MCRPRDTIGSVLSIPSLMLQQCSIVLLNRTVIYAKILSPLSVSSLSFPHPFLGLCCPAPSFAQALSSQLPLNVLACSATPFRLHALLFNGFVLHHLVAFYRFFLFSSPPSHFSPYYFLDVIFSLFTLSLCFGPRQINRQSGTFV